MSIIYHNDNMTLYCVREILRSEANRVFVCQDIASLARPFYTLLAVTDRGAARKLSAIFAADERETTEPPFISCFSEGEQLCYLFPYRAERSFESFADGQMLHDESREDVAVNFVMACISSPLPYPLLYLELKQEQVHIERDNTVFLTPYIDLSFLDESTSQSECASLCAAMLLDVLRNKTRKELRSLKLIRQKAMRGAYREFVEIYRDIRLTAVKKRKKGLRAFFAFLKRNKDAIFRVLLVLSVICVVVALVIFLSYAIFGDFFLFKLFGEPLRIIGTERLDI